MVYLELKEDTMKYLIVACLLLSGCVEVGLGVSRVHYIPDSHLTGHGQFHISVSHRHDISKNVVLETQWNHYSNGAQLGIGEYPNYGLDFYGTQLKYKF
jgi:hypothetical protein